ncbi:RDS/peripherin-like protein xRDS35 isoform X1 [Leptopilina boulardi]|uniref:RDS/peripherin-like protein xRDS35 isoform X1 n=1 Tax=Leptopilina boulardi TaxID=63433 RepID=UPI0021F568CF|nr:RDS/peripherin-like protein xRDS35 isoform X1 [Leptopilina boulardi]
MANNELCSCTENSPRNNQIFSQTPCIFCNCDWESKIGRRIAVSLVLLEIKRFFLLALEMMIELSVLQFSGAIKSIILSFVDVALGIPCALAAISSIRKRQEQPRYSKVKILLKCVVLIIVICAILNIVTLASIAYHVSVKQSTIKGIFNFSMNNYLNDNYYKYNLDEIQFELQCCGHTTYTDWFLLDWKKSDHVSRKKKNNNLRAINSDKEFRDRDVPFSCCNIHSLLSCVNIKMTEADVKTINSLGCSKILSYILIRIVIFGYIMTALVIIIYIILLYFIIKITRKPLPQDCPSDCSCLSTENSSPRCPLLLQNSPCSCSSSSTSLSVGKEIPCSKNSFQTFRKSSFYWRNNSFNKRKRITTKKSSYSSYSDEESSMEYYVNREIAQIKPSVHKQHEISQKSSKSSVILSKVE